MSSSLRQFAGCLVLLAATAALVCSPPVVAEPGAPTLGSLEPPAPAPPPRAAPAPAASNVGADESAIRQVVQASTGAYNAESWDVFMAQICAARQGSFPLDMIKGQRADRGPMQTTVISVSINGDSATATTVMSDRTTVTTPYHMVREGGWKICG